MNNNNPCTKVSLIRDLLRRNTVLLLTLISFFVIGFDLTTEAAVENNEVEFFTAVLINSTCTSLPVIVSSPENIELTSITLYFNNASKIISSKLSNSFRSRPPPSI
ncbi:MAG: hypothetical protein ABI543_03615 [Ignavibacteria bacterium]